MSYTSWFCPQFLDLTGGNHLERAKMRCQKEGFPMFLLQMYLGMVPNPKDLLPGYQWVLGWFFTNIFAKHRKFASTKIEFENFIRQGPEIISVFLGSRVQLTFQIVHHSMFYWGAQSSYNEHFKSHKAKDCGIFYQR